MQRVDCLNGARKRLLILLPVLFLTALIVPVSMAQQELAYEQYKAIALAADRLNCAATYEPQADQLGMYVVLGDRYSTLHVYYLTGDDGQRVWSSRSLNGTVEEVITVDLDGDEFEDAFVARTSAGMIYIWSMNDYRMIYESLPNDFQRIACFTAANMDEDPAVELVINADLHIYYLDGTSLTRDWTSMQEYEATQILCGDVDGDDRMEIVLNTGQVIDGASGDVEWEEDVFGSKIELLDFDGDGILEVLTESPGTPMRVFEIDTGREKRYQ